MSLAFSPALLCAAQILLQWLFCFPALLPGTQRPGSCVCRFFSWRVVLPHCTLWKSVQEMARWALLCTKPVLIGQAFNRLLHPCVGVPANDVSSHTSMHAASYHTCCSALILGWGLGDQSEVLHAITAATPVAAFDPRQTPHNPHGKHTLQYT